MVHFGHHLINRNQKDYEKLQKKYPNDYSDQGCPVGDQYLDWHKLAKDYDGFQLATRKFIPGITEQWDVESTAWFNMSKLNFVGTTKV